MPPLPEGTRYRFKDVEGGKLRLAFAPNSNKVIESKMFVKKGGKYVKRKGLKEKFKERRKNK
jgi:hypothetical protein